MSVAGLAFQDLQIGLLFSVLNIGSRGMIILLSLRVVSVMY